MHSLPAKLQDMNWDDLRYVLATARSGTLTETAKRLGVNPTTVSRRLDAIEKKLGTRLFEKTTRGFIPTDNGKEVLPDAERMELLVNNIERKIIGKDSQLSGSLRITTIDNSAVFDSPLYTSFSELFPHVTLEFSVSYATQNLNRREADVAIRWTDNPPENLVGRKLARVTYGLYAHKKIISTYGDQYLNPGYPWLDWDDSMGAYITKRWMQKHLSQPRIVARLDSAITMMQFVNNGLGVAFVPKLYGEAEPSLSCLLDPGDEFSNDLWILTHPDLRNTARVSAFIKHAVLYYRDRFEFQPGEDLNQVIS